MSEDKQTDDDSERTLLTLDQLSQTIEVMTSVVNRLRQHLSEQLKAQAAAQLAEREQEERSSAEQESTSAKSAKDKESFVVEIKQQEVEPTRKNTKTLH